VQGHTQLPALLSGPVKCFLSIRFGVTYYVSSLLLIAANSCYVPFQVAYPLSEASLAAHSPACDTSSQQQSYILNMTTFAFLCCFVYCVYSEQIIGHCRAFRSGASSTPPQALPCISFLFFWSSMPITDIRSLVERIYFVEEASGRMWRGDSYLSKDMGRWRF
jgi:hypothetical protein